MNAQTLELLILLALSEEHAKRAKKRRRSR